MKKMALGGPNKIMKNSSIMCFHSYKNTTYFLQVIKYKSCKTYHLGLAVQAEEEPPQVEVESAQQHVDEAHLYGTSGTCAVDGTSCAGTTCGRCASMANAWHRRQAASLHDR